MAKGHRETSHQGPTWTRGAPRGVGRTTCPCGWQVGPPWCFFAPIFIIYSKIILQKSMLRFELRRIAFSSVDILGPEFQLLAIPLSWYNLHFKREKTLELNHNVKYIIEIG